MSGIILHSDQDAVLPHLRSALRTHNSVILRAPCRFGKTVVSAYMIQKIVQRGHRVLFCVHRRELARQASNTLSDFDIPHSFIMGGEDYDDRLNAHVATAGALMRRPELAYADWAVIDEAHLWANGHMAGIIDTLKASGAKIILLTATPALGNGNPLTRIADAIVYGPKERDLIDAGRLAHRRGGR